MGWIFMQICFGLVTIIIPFSIILFWGLRKYPLMASILVGLSSLSVAIYPALLIYSDVNKMIVSAVIIGLSMLGSVLTFRMYYYFTNKALNDTILVNKKV